MRREKTMSKEINLWYVSNLKTHRTLLCGEASVIEDPFQRCLQLVELESNRFGGNPKCQPVQ
jgi:hypothetical protein